MQDKRVGRKQSPLWSIPQSDLADLVRRSSSLTEILKFFKLTNNGACMKTLKKILAHYGIDYQHIKAGAGQWNRKWNKVRFDIDFQKYIVRWQRGQEKGWIGDGYAISKHIKRYLREKHSNQCQQCGWHEVNPVTQKVPLQVDHVDGNASHCQEENLKLLCPNCHSLTPTFGRLNKKTCRRHR